MNAIVDLLDELVTDVVAVPEHVDAVSGDPDDDRILAAAAAGGADLLISGDTKHLLPLSQHAGIRIIKPQAFLAQITG
jgi:predicted nucleic acid-binding protein